MHFPCHTRIKTDQIRSTRTPNRAGALPLLFGARPQRAAVNRATRSDGINQGPHTHMVCHNIALG